MTTIVTGFIDLGKYGMTRKPVTTYHNFAKLLTLKVPLPLHCFVEKENIELVTNIRKELGFENITTVEEIKIEDLFLYKHLDKLSDNLKKAKEKGIKYEYPDLYIVVINGKLDMLQRAMNSNVYNSKNFMWLDYGILFRNFHTDDVNGILNIANNIKPKICLGLIDDKRSLAYEKLMFGWNWVIISGLITFNQEDNQVFFDLWKSEAETAILKNNLYPFEEAIFYKIWKDHPSLFTIYYANYDTCIYKYTKNYKPNESKDKIKYEYFDKLVELSNILNGAKLDYPLSIEDDNPKNIIVDTIFNFLQIDTIYKSGFKEKLNTTSIFDQLLWLRNNSNISFY